MARGENLRGLNLLIISLDASLMTGPTISTLPYIFDSGKSYPYDDHISISAWLAQLLAFLPATYWYTNHFPRWTTSAYQTGRTITRNSDFTLDTDKSTNLLRESYIVEILPTKSKPKEVRLTQDDFNHEWSLHPATAVVDRPSPAASKPDNQTLHIVLHQRHPGITDQYQW